MSAPPTDDARVAASTTDENPSWNGMAVAIGFATCSTLLLEIALTRIFSVILWYHYGFMVISLALLGIGLSGVYVYLYPERFPRSTAPRKAARAAAAFAISTVAALSVFHVLVTMRTTWPLSTSELVLSFLLMAVPFFFAGLAIAIPLARYTERIGQLYGADLIGAAIGAVLVIPLLALLGGHRTVVAAACLAAVASILYARSKPKGGGALGGFVALAVCAATLAIAGPMDLFQIRFSKHGEEHDIVYEKWNSFSRVSVMEVPGVKRQGWHLSSKAPPGGVSRRRIRIDGGAGTNLLAFDGDFGPLEFLRYDVSSLGYQVRPQDNVLIIGSGAGRDILTAKSIGIETVHAVEINPIIVDIARNRFTDFTLSPYDLPGVTFTVRDARSFLATSKDRYDHVQISAVDTIAASASGALSLVEQSLYTTEAFFEYYDHLADDGILSITRPFNLKRIEVTLRTVDLVRAAWSERGIADPAQHLVVIGRRGGGGSGWGMMLVSRSPFSEADLASIKELCSDLSFSLMYAPGHDDNIAEIEAILGPERDSFIDDYPLVVGATTDDRPFFFYFRRPLSALRDAITFGEHSTTRAHATPDVLMTLFFFILVLTLTTAFVIPIALGRLRLRTTKGSASKLMYFAGIGLGFILVEIGLLQRYTLLLGQPVFAFALILGTMLVFSGCGSFITHGREIQGVRRLSRTALIAILAGIGVHVLFMPALLEMVMHLSLPLRVGFTVITIAPLALVMGIALPSGMRMLERTAPQVVPWGWGVNGSFSVLGTVVAMCTSVFFGITMSIMLGFAAYCLALLTPWSLGAEETSV